MTHIQQFAPQIAEIKTPAIGSKPVASAHSTAAPAWERALGTQPLVALKLPLQAKLAVNQPGDSYEQEADRVADTVMRMPAPRLQRAQCACGGEAGSDGECATCKQKRLDVQRKARANITPTEVPASVHETIRSPGQPLDSGTRMFMESRFGADFGEVRVHTNEQAAASAQAVHANAYTVGQDIIFLGGQYTPGTSAGKKLLAHELTHVVQQAQSSTEVAMTQEVNDPADPAEYEAEIVARAVVQNSHVPAIVAVGKGIQRDVGWAQRGDDPYGTIESPWCESPEGRNRRRLAGRIYGDTLCRAASNVALLNESHPSDYWFVPQDRRPFIRSTGERTWELAPPTIDITDPYELSCFVAGVNEGIAAYQEDERFWEHIANGLQLLSMALTTSSVIRMTAGSSATPVRITTQRSGTRPRLVLHQGGTPSRVTIQGGRVVSSPPLSSVTQGSSVVGGRGMSAAPQLAPDPVAQMAPRPIPQLVPQPAPQSAQAPSPHTTPLPGPVVLPMPMPQPLPEEREGDCGPLPISWPTELPLPDEVGIILIRANAGTREAEGIDDRGPEQRALTAEINAARRIPFMQQSEEAPFRVCFGYDPMVYYDAHHIHPLFLGGGDYEDNLCGLEHNRHVAGHRRLNDQNAWINTYQQCGINSGTLTRHPQLTEYFIAEEK